MISIIVLPLEFPPNAFVTAIFDLVYLSDEPVYQPWLRRRNGTEQGIAQGRERADLEKIRLERRASGKYPLMRVEAIPDADANGGWRVATEAVGDHAIGGFVATWAPLR